MVNSGEFKISAWPPDPAMYTAEYLRDRQAIIDVVDGICTYADQREWDKVAASFAPQVVLDYTSMVAAMTGGDGGKPQVLTPRGIIDLWRSFLPGFQYTQHVMSNHQVHVQEHDAFSLSYVYATHILPNESGQNFWVVGGYYNHDLVRTHNDWKVTRMKLNFRFDLGNRQLQTLAAQIVKAGNHRTAAEL